MKYLVHQLRPFLLCAVLASIANHAINQDVKAAGSDLALLLSPNRDYAVVSAVRRLFCRSRTLRCLKPIPRNKNI
ncbi:hypothetical protein Poly41_52050 [Novipirellula artificiosorum]|uniref:Uncharacterized protein n=1 Tax=Novipirellula artificiosorum TaxID=2528016 RepID=A0A5C6D7P6_9BACT|nr:hypothetical protein Poly41_52050 [Novipirellula artificiosorum]